MYRKVLNFVVSHHALFLALVILVGHAENGSGGC